MPWRGPRKAGEYPTLGFGILEALSEILPSPSDVEAPLQFTNEQAMLILAWYRIDPDSGEFVYRRGCLEMSKGWGKSPLLAAVAIAELALPVLFAGWDASGEPVARPWGTRDSPPPWLQIAAVSEDQTDNTYDVLYEMLVANGHRAASALGIDQGRTRLYLHGRPGRLEPVTAAAGSREGQRVTFAVLDETHLWTRQNKGIKLANTLRRNAAKMGGRTMESTNAPELGERSVAEATGSEAEEGEPGILFHAKRPPKEPDPSWTDRRMLKALDVCYGDARWIDRDRILAEIRDPATAWHDALRFYFNIRVPGAGKAVDPRKWSALARDVAIEPGIEVGLGFHGSTTTTAAALRACTREGHSFLIAAWSRPAGAKDWSVPREAVHEAVGGAFELYRVGRMLADPPGWQSEIETWAKTWGEEVVLGFPTARPARFSPAVDRWLVSLREKAHTHDNDPTTNEHVRSSRLRKVHEKDPEDDSRTMYVLERGEAGHQVAAAIADVLALEAAMTMPEAEPAKAFAMRWT